MAELLLSDAQQDEVLEMLNLPKRQKHPGLSDRLMWEQPEPQRDLQTASLIDGFQRIQYDEMLADMNHAIEKAKVDIYNSAVQAMQEVVLAWECGCDKSERCEHYDSLRHLVYYNLALVKLPYPHRQ